MPIARANNLGFRYGRRSVALHEVSFTIEPGVTALLGPNGAGKSTLMELMTGLRRAQTGSLEVLGVDSSERNARRVLASKVGYLPQRLGYVPSFSVREFVSYAAWLKAVPPSDSEAVDRALDATNLAPQSKKKMRALSGGTLRRAGIAAALVSQPELLILDEPAAGLDPEQADSLREVMIRIGESGASILLSTHSTDDAAAVCSQLIVLTSGSVAYAGTKVAFLQRDPQQGTTLRDAYLAAVSGAER